MGKSTFDKYEKYRAVKSVYDKLNVRKIATDKMDAYYDIAIKKLDSLSLKNKSISDILDLAGNLMKRTK